MPEGLFCWSLRSKIIVNNFKFPKKILMKILIQRVKEGSVTVENIVISKIGPGMVILFGIGLHDTMDMVALAVNKILNLRL